MCSPHNHRSHGYSCTGSALRLLSGLHTGPPPSAQQISNAAARLGSRLSQTFSRRTRRRPLAERLESVAGDERPLGHTRTPNAHYAGAPPRYQTIVSGVWTRTRRPPRVLRSDRDVRVARSFDLERSNYVDTRSVHLRVYARQWRVSALANLHVVYAAANAATHLAAAAAQSRQQLEFSVCVGRLVGHVELAAAGRHFQMVRRDERRRGVARERRRNFAQRPSTSSLRLRLHERLSLAAREYGYASLRCARSTL